MVAADLGLLKGNAMGESLPQAAASATWTSWLRHCLSAFAVAPVVEIPTDLATLSSWRAESRAMRAQASALAEWPPLPSY
jgi:hypothetical protein